jgi:hypothetical protein
LSSHLLANSPIQNFSFFCSRIELIFGFNKVHT